jgi:hypothetical protein
MSGLGGAGSASAEHCPASCFGVDHVGLALAAPCGPIGAVDFDDRDALAAEVTRQGSAIRPSSFHARTADIAIASRPVQQLAVALRVGRERAGCHSGTHGRDDRRDVDLLVGIHTENDLVLLTAWTGQDGGGHAAPRSTSVVMADAGPGTWSEL